MPDLNLELIIQKVHALLKADAKTKDLYWYLGRMTPLEIPTLPAAGVSFAPGIALTFVSVGGSAGSRGGEVPVRIRVWTAVHEGAAKAEERIQDWVGKILDVLWANVQLDISGYATKPWLREVNLPELDTNPEAAPAWAEATIIASYQVRL